MNWGKIWSSIVDFFTVGRLLNIALFFAILVIGIIVIKLLMNITRRLLKKTKMERIAQQFICTIIKFVLWLVLILLLLSQIGIEINGILTAFSAVILAVGMALQNAIANVANGIIIISNHMFKKDDYIIAGGQEGRITDINFLFTTIITNDNRRVTLPNSTIINSTVTNLGAFPTRRVDFTFSVAYESDVELVKKIVLDVMKSDGRVLLDPAPFCRLKTLAASSIDFFAYCWCDNADYWDVYYYVMENVYNEFKRHNISIPYAQLEVRERKDNVKMPIVGKGLPQRVEKVREHNKKLDLENASLKDMIEEHKNKASKRAKKAEEKAAKKKAKENAKPAAKDEKAEKPEPAKEAKAASVKPAKEEKGKKDKKK